MQVELDIGEGSLRYLNRLSDLLFVARSLGRQGRMCTRGLLAEAVSWALFASLAMCHEPGVSSVEIEGDQVRHHHRRDEFTDRFPTANLEAAGPLLVEHTINASWISVDGERCLVGKPVVEPVDEDGVRLTAPLLCADGDRWLYYPTWLRGRSDGHQHSVSAFGKPVGVFGRQHERIDLVPEKRPS